MVDEKIMVEKSTTQLINEIYNRPALWDRGSSHYHNRLTTDSQWDEIADITGLSKDRAKIKWKRLRDIYRKELKKIIALEERDGRAPDQPRWIHFASMDFLRTTLSGDLKNGSSIAEIKKEPSASDSDDDSKHQQLQRGSGGGNGGDDHGPYSDHLRHHRENSLWNHQTLMEPTVEIQTGASGGAVGRADENPQKRRRVETDEDDDDMHFLKSLVSYLKMLPPVKKLKVRNNIQMAILAELSEDAE